MNNTGLIKKPIYVLMVATAITILSLVIVFGCIQSNNTEKPYINSKLYVGGKEGTQAKIYVIKFIESMTDVKIGKVIDIPGDFTPNYLTLSPDGSKLYCLETTSNHLLIINTDNDSYDTSIDITSWPAGMAFTSDGSKTVIQVKVISL
jgi:YVTN family beta-propeller protein